jgi:Na+-transporting methylmalonyl-CoA/oxaloacetate decarboxylase beta subunit
MLVVSFILRYLAIVMGFEPLLLLPIAFGRAAGEPAEHGADGGAEVDSTR